MIVSLKPLVSGLVLLFAILVASTVASSVALEVIGYVDELGWWTVALLAWPVFLFVWSAWLD